MSATRLTFLTTLAMLAFAGNSVLCRLALRDTEIDPATFTTLRLTSGALVLWVLLHWPGRQAALTGGNWASAAALFVYAAAFSWAYIQLDAATGALLLFAAVQVSMLSIGLLRGERLSPVQSVGFALALIGLAALLLPSASTPPALPALSMLAAGVAWGLYSLRGRGASNPLAATAGNFVRAVPLALGLSALALPWLSVDANGALYALASGAITSGLGYAIWYAALPGLRASAAASVQLSVPVITAAGGLLLLNEAPSLLLMIASLAILGGIALVIGGPRAASR
ncbi:DMT family transporter [Halopseudomonas maritima]|uniref:DMT family transporter n=1 Tax=Halopseudomonas maritima TaxID=2918528 RepID=UPI001EEB503D|nr:DMT family transporter [Halopseudomonas maritima]UJJ31317.1 DMT family transporter [Halopseudomonas maritima]